jgi:hypothetical protein
MGRRVPSPDFSRVVPLALRLPPALRWTAPRTWQAAILLFLAAWILYTPGLDRVFVLDQTWYFAELDGSTSLADGLRHYDYAASRRYWKGDDALFRPLLFVWLAVENRLFSYRHVWWNGANITLHALTALFLFRLLVAIRPSPFALPAALLFVVLKPSLELVLWNHLGGYLLAALSLLIALRAFVLMVRTEGEPSPRTTAVFALAFTAGNLLYEVIVPVSLLAGLLAVWVAWRRDGWPAPRRTLVLLAPVLIFSILYSFHLLRVERFSYVDRSDVQGLFDSANVLRVIPRSAEVMWRWTLELALPSAIRFLPAEFNRLAKEYVFSWRSPVHVINAVLFLSTLILLAVSVSREHLRRTLPLLVLLAGALCAYLVVVCLGRPQGEVLSIAYYLYLFCLLLVVIAYAVVDFDRIKGWTRAAAAVIVAALVVLHATESRMAIREIGRVNQRASTFLTRVIRFIDAHKSEADLSIAMASHPPALDPEVVLVEGYPDHPTSVQVRRLTEILFKRYYDAEKPKYVLGVVPF